MMEMAGEVGVEWTGRLLNMCMQEGMIPKEWRMDLIVPIWKRKGDVHDPRKYRGITLEGDFGEEQQGEMNSRRDVHHEIDGREETDLQSLLYYLSQGVHPVCCSSPLPKPLLFFTEVTF